MIDQPAAPRLSLMRCGITGSGILVLLASMSWAGQELGLNASPLYLGMFPHAPMGWDLLMPMGLIWAAIQGFVLGAAGALIYNGLRRLGPN